VAESIAGDLRRRIISGDLADGTELPAEAKLLEDYPASRPSLREALRILETEQLVAVRRGKLGGTIVKKPTWKTAAYHLGLLLDHMGTPLEDLANARKLLEPLCATLAAAREDHVAVAGELRAIIEANKDALDDGVGFTTSAMDFHAALVRSANNHTLQLVVGMLESVWSTQERGWAQEADRSEQYPSLDSRRAVVNAHERIVKAIAKGDGAAASAAAAAHLDASQRFIASSGSAIELLDEYGFSRLQ